jgi:outer membrane protein OmpA-like peptidoglycan-associated protein
MRTRAGLKVATAVVVALAFAGCASKKYVRSEVGASEGRIGERVGELGSQVEANQSRLDEQGQTLDAHGKSLDELSKTTREALERAIAAGKLAEGRFLYETLLTDDQVQFGFDSAQLGDEARAALDAFAAEIQQRDENVYIEIQGHTDSTGSEEHNLELGEARAEAVRRYLNKQHGFPLHRMSVISYGESEPIAPNDTRDGRAHNRRVVLVVLK